MNSQKKSPLRVPDWRHQRVCELLANRRLDPGIEINSLVRCYLYYLRWLQKKPLLPPRHTSFPTSPQVDSMRFAHRLQTDDRCTGVRDELQTRILANQSEIEIASRTGLRPLEVRIFEYLFFDIRSRLNYLEFVFDVVLKVNDSLSSEEELARSIKTLAYCAGATMVETVLLLGRTHDSWYLVQLREVFGRVGRSGLQSFLSSNSQQRLKSDIAGLLTSLIGESATVELLAERSMPEVASVDWYSEAIEEASCTCPLQVAQLAMMRAA